MFKRIKYISENGTVSLGGGQDSFLRVRSITGIGLMQREYSSASVSAGQRETGRRDLPRTITIGVDLIGKNTDLEKFERIVYADGILELDFGEIRRRIRCKLGNMSDPEWIIPKKLASFAVQFICDYPYFEDADATVADVMSFTNNVIDSFTLPCVFTTAINQAAITVSGLKNIFPIVRIGCTEAPSTESNYGFKISNITTDKYITVYHPMHQGEVITIDFKERSITSSISGNVINLLSDDSSMDELYLRPGKNIIQVDELSASGTVYVQVEYRSEHFTAEY